MAIAVINSQGVVLMVAAYTASVPAYTDFAAADAIGCPQSVGNIEETRAVTEYKCMSNNESAKALGSIERGNVEIGLLFDPTDAAGQDALKTHFAANTNFLFGIELPDKGGTGTGGNGTTFAFIGIISAVSIGIVQDEAVTYTVTIEIASDVTEIAEVDDV